MSPTINVTPAASGGSVTAAAIEATFTAAGQIYQGTGSGAGGLVLPPGYEVGYDQITAPVTVISTTESAGTTLINCAAHTFDGGAVMAEVFSPKIIFNLIGTMFVRVSLFEGATQIGRLGECDCDNVGDVQMTFSGRLRFTPSAAAHTYTLTAFVSNSTGAVFTAGAGGTGAFVPAFVRFTKV